MSQDDQGYKPRRIRLPWTLFRSVSNSHAVKLTIFIPLIGYWILFNEKLLPYIELSRKITGGAAHAATTEPAHIPFNLLLLYFGLCLIAAGSLLYQLFCAREIRNYGSSAEYVAQERAHLSRPGRAMISHFLDKNDRAQYDSFLKNLYGYGEHGKPTLVTEDEKFLPDLLDYHFGFLNGTYPPVRVLIATLYALGFIALAIPSLKIFAKVTLLLMQT